MGTFSGLLTKLSICSTVLFITFSAHALELEAGDKLELGIDWERIERGLKTGDFSCHGTCLQVSINWSEVWAQISGKKFRDTQKQNLAFCISEYQKAKTTMGYIQNDNTLNTNQADALLKMQDNALQAVDLVCIKNLGQSHTERLKKEIFETK